MGTLSKLFYERQYAHFPGQALAHQYYEAVARGPFRVVAVTGTYSPLADVKCSSVCFTNTTGKMVGVKRGAGPVIIKIPDNGGKIFDVVDNANELSIANAEDGAAVTVQYECGGEAI